MVNIGVPEDTSLSLYINVPNELKEKKQWLVWKAEKTVTAGKEKWTKVPYSVHGGVGKTNDSSTWGTFEEATSLKGVSGIGFVFNNDYTGIDYDNLRESQDEPFPEEVLREIRTIGSYTEISPSGKGLHVIVRGKIETKGRHKNNRGLFSVGRYFTITGNTLNGFDHIVENQLAIELLYKKWYEEDVPDVAPREEKQFNINEPALSDEKIIEIATNAANGSKFTSLMRGDFGGYPSQSEADAALCCMIAFYTNDFHQIDSIFSRSGLYRPEKWGRADYKERTINGALSVVTDKYTPRHNEGAQPSPTQIPYTPQPRLYNPKLDMSAIPEGNWIRMFYDHHTKHNRAPYPEYFHAGAMAMMTFACGRHIYITLSGKRVFTNIWPMILGASSISHKSDSIDPVITWLRILYPDKEISSEFSGAGLLEELEKHGDGYLITDECGSILNRVNNSKEAATIRDFMCKLADNVPVIKKQLSSRGKKGDDGVVSIINGFPTVMFATTPEVFSEHTTKVDTYSGWLLRFLFYNPNYPKDPVDFVFGYKREEKESRLIARYKKIISAINTLTKDNTEIEAILEDGALEIFQEWHIRMENQLKFDGGVAQQAFVRLEVVALKLAINYTLASEEFVSGDGIFGSNVYISKKYMETAIAQVDSYFLPHAVSVFEMVERNITLNVQDRIVSVLKSHGNTMSVRDLMKDLHIRKKDFDEHLQALEESGEVIRHKQEETGSVGRPQSDIVDLLPTRH